jgi:hypothetical protein
VAERFELSMWVNLYWMTPHSIYRAIHSLGCLKPLSHTTPKLKKELPNNPWNRTTLTTRPITGIEPIKLRILSGGTNPTLSDSNPNIKSYYDFVKLHKKKIHTKKNFKAYSQRGS